MARAFIGSEILLAPGDQIVGARGGARLKLDDRARRFAPFFVRLGNHGDDLDGGMFVEGVLDFDRGNVLAAGNDDVLGAVLELDVAVGVNDAEIAGMKPAAGKGGVG